MGGQDACAPGQLDKETADGVLIVSWGFPDSLERMGFA